MAQTEEANTIENPFQQQLLVALEHFTDPAWLGKYSPLATPYFLGEHLLVRQSEDDSAVSRGRALQKLLWDTAQALIEQEDGGTYLYRILELTFFRPKSLSQVLYELGISKSTFYRPAHRPRAIQKLEQALIRRLKPALRLEEPPNRQQIILGRESVIKEGLEKLQNGQSVAIIGNNGAGKTMVAVQLAGHWAPKPVFWFTVRPGLNDQPSGFLFSLGYFLQRQGVSGLWLQLVADQGRVYGEVEMGMLRRDLMRLQGEPPLLCIDEVDLLKPADVEAHRQLLAFFDSLRGLTPVLLIGQQIPVETDWVQALEGLPLAETGKMLAENDIPLSAADLATLQMHTQGNPRLLQLFITLHRSGESLEDVLPRMSASPSLESLLNRIWRRLSEHERNQLAALAVFRRPAPCDAWSGVATFETLVSQNLVQLDDQSGANLLPALKAVIYHLLAPETREALHLEAAAIRAAHSEYTAAAYHYIHGGQPQKAIWLWYTHRQQEIDQGQGDTALELFAGLSRNQFNEAEREILVLLRSELRLLGGQYNEIKPDLYVTVWQNPVLKGRASRIQGDVAYERSRFDEAIQSYREGLDSLRAIGGEMALFHKDIGKTYWQKRDLEQAWREALLARYEVEHLQGDIQEAMGNYVDARRYYEQALSLAEKLGYVEGEGKTSNNLAWVLFRLGEIDAANQKWDKASHFYQQIGRLTWQAGIKVNQAISYTDTGRPQKAVPLLQEALAVFESLGHARGNALAAYNLAEAYLSLADIDTAEQFTWLAIQQEEVSLMPASFNILARIRLAQKQPDEAEIFCRKSISLAEQNQNLFSLGYSWRTSGEAHLAQHKADEALAALEKAMAIFQELELSDEIEKTQAIIHKLPLPSVHHRRH